MNTGACSERRCAFHLTPSPSSPAKNHQNELEQIRREGAQGLQVNEYISNGWQLTGYDKTAGSFSRNHALHDRRRATAHCGDRIEVLEDARHRAVALQPAVAKFVLNNHLWKYGDGT